MADGGFEMPMTSSQAGWASFHPVRERPEDLGSHRSEPGAERLPACTAGIRLCLVPPGLGEAKSFTKSRQDCVFDMENADLPRVTRQVDLTTRDLFVLFEHNKNHSLRVPTVYALNAPASHD